MRFGSDIPTEIAISDCINLKELEVFGQYSLSRLTDLDLSSVPNLEILSLSGNYCLSNLNIKNNFKLKELDISYNKKLNNLGISHLKELEVLNIRGIRGDKCVRLLDIGYHHPNLRKVDCSENPFTELDFSGCLRLEEINCSRNELNNLDFSGCTNLRKVDCSENLLTNLDLTNNFQLEELNISNNNFPEQELSFLSHLVELKNLNLGNNRHKRIQRNIYNRFYGSLESLKNLTRLKKLGISNTDLDCGVEYLPLGIEEISHSFEEKSISKVRKISQLLDLVVDKEKLKK